jgi:hypothetical protein
MKYFRIATVLLMIGLVGNIQAQDFPIQNLSFKKSLRMADYLYSIGSFYNAAEYYMAVNDKQAGNAYVLNQIADCEYKLRDYKQLKTGTRNRDLNDAGIRWHPIPMGWCFVHKRQVSDA